MKRLPLHSHVINEFLRHMDPGRTTQLDRSY